MRQDLELQTRGLGGDLHKRQDWKQSTAAWSQTQPLSCTRVRRKPRTQLNTEIQLVIFEPLGLGQTIKLWVWKLCS